MKSKLFFLSSFLLFSLTVNAQDMPVDTETQKITYTGVVDVPGMKKDDLFNRTKAWFVTSSGITKMALELEDKEAGKLLGKINNPIKVNNPPLNNKFEIGNVVYNITVIVKDDKYKYTFTNFVHDSDGRDKVISQGGLENKKTTAKPALLREMPSPYQWKKLKEDTNEIVLGQIEALKKAMSGAAKSETDF